MRHENFTEQILMHVVGSPFHGSISYKNYLNLGCGERFHLDWTNMDVFPSAGGILPADLRMGFPLGNSSMDLIYSSHLLQLLNETDAEHFFGECFRCLRPGGIIRLVVPDAEIAAEKYLERLRQGRSEKTSEPFSLFGEIAPVPISEKKMRLLEKILRGARELSIRLVLTRKQYAQLQFGRTEADLFGVKSHFHSHSLSLLLKKQGFENIVLVSANESSIADWETFHLDVDESGRTLHDDSLYIEARKGLDT